MVKYNAANKPFIDPKHQNWEGTTESPNMEDTSDIVETHENERLGNEQDLITQDSDDNSHVMEINNVGEAEESARDPERQAWQYDETLALIAAVESRYEDLYHPKNKRGFWDRISEELQSNNLQVSNLKPLLLTTLSSILLNF